MIRLFQAYALSGAALALALLWLGISKESYWWFNAFLIATSSVGIIWATGREHHADS